ncbi:MAG: DUF423 domain-containing protein [Bernardetiaceae bacterium]|nr:DUF423 domain-containing protein [Bernardetiaceae bacterium]
MTTRFGFLGALLGALAVALGAFGAHALKPLLAAAQRTDTFETAVKYHFYHALSLVLIGWLARQAPSPAWMWAGWLHLIGIGLFSGALYLLCFTGQTWLGAVAPLGGTSLIAGWLLMARAAWQHKF